MSLVVGSQGSSSGNTPVLNNPPEAKSSSDKKTVAAVEKKFKCESCNRQFNNILNLKNHFLCASNLLLRRWAINENKKGTVAPQEMRESYENPDSPPLKIIGNDPS